jgi:hypothetical protein
MFFEQSASLKLESWGRLTGLLKFKEIENVRSEDPFMAGKKIQNT